VRELHANRKRATKTDKPFDIEAAIASLLKSGPPDPAWDTFFAGGRLNAAGRQAIADRLCRYINAPPQRSCDGCALMTDIQVLLAELEAE